MSAMIVDGKAVAAGIEAEVARVVGAGSAAGWRAPRLVVVLCNEDPGSATYVGHKNRAAERVGIRGETLTPPVTSRTDTLVDLVGELGADADVDAILVQLPLPAHVDQDRVLAAVPPAKDVDGFHPYSFGRLAEGAPLVVPCTPAGCLELLRRYDVPIAGARAVVVGRSVIVGRPMALLLLNAHATVTICHSRTVDLPAVCREADILVAATGRPGMIDAGFIKPGAAVVDVGTTRVEGRLRGDVDRASVEPVAGLLTPVPGGVGPMTIAMLMRNTVGLAVARRPAGAPAVPWA
jgi:methylenetetrahydrofolate dehydrogenase (NADP+)/methenyltetrahydrofolate cyclohydrolase